jgi:hypothetical protein
MSKATDPGGRSSSATSSARGKPSDRWRAGAPLHIDIAEVQMIEGKLLLFMGIDRTARLAVANLWQLRTNHRLASGRSHRR